MHVSTKLRTLSVSGIVAGITLLSTAAHATPLFPGATIGIFGTTAALHPNLAGVVIEDTMRPFTFHVGATSYTGEVQDRVVRESATGTLDFYYRILLYKQTLQGEQLMVWRTNYPMEATGAGISTDVDWRIDGVGISGPEVAARSADGKMVIFVYKGFVIGPGSAKSTRFSYISTNAKNYDQFGRLSFQVTGGTVVTMTCWEPKL